MEDEKIDVLLATYNGEKYLREQIESILNQTYQNIRLVISDDCSTDNTRNILMEYLQKDRRVEIHFQEKNLGYVKNFEFLLKQVTNSYFMLSDQDDFWLPQKIEKSYENIKSNNAILAFGDLEVVDKELKTIYPSFNDYMKLTRKIQKFKDYRMQYLYNCVTGCTIIAKKELIEEVLPIPTDSKYAIHDLWIGLIATLNGKVSYMPEKYIKYRQHGNNQVGTDKLSHKFNKLSQVRELFINVKLGLFETYVKHSEYFPNTIQELNKMGYDYFKMVSKKKNFNFKNWKTFHILYKYETASYYILNFLIMNMPFFARILFKIRYVILKLLKKR